MGTSGFSYRAWKGIFYPQRLPNREMLAYYASRLTTVELNTTFYRNPAESTVASWAAGVPDGFRFAVKAHRRITHNRRLKDVEQALEVFGTLIDGLGDRLGPVLFQLPPTAEYVPGRLEAFLQLLPPHWRVAFQFRHASWHQSPALNLLERAAICYGDGEPEPGPLGRGAFIYLRLRRDAYSPRRLSVWGRRIGSYLAEGRDVFAYFKHEFRGPVYAERLSAQVQTSVQRYNPGKF